MRTKYIPPFIWLAAGAVLCIFLIRLGSVDRLALSQIFLFYGALTIADAGLIVHTIINRKENVSVTNYGFKLMGEALLFLIIVTFMIGDIFFA